MRKERRTDDESLCANNNWLSFIKANYFGSNCINFSGRASRKEFWVCSLFMLIVDAVTTVYFDNLVGLLFYYYCLISFIALTSRRCHDINLSFKWMIYPFAVLFFFRFPILFFPFSLIAIFLRAFYLIYPALACLGIFYFIILPFFKGNIDDNGYGDSVY